ncbi:MAG: hydroxymethylbilane synthase [Euryarchaeota archaeon]|nr:hydroxymethylbilane synthase [Euryarchaeota archaeon]
MTGDVLRVGTRGSPLALRQARMVAGALRRLRLGAEIVPVKTRADTYVERRIFELGTGVFVRELDGALLDGDLDIAVHSLKDIPTGMDPRLGVVAVLPRGPRHDLAITRWGIGLIEKGARLGTSSARRRAQWLRHRPDLRVAEIRGNVETRLEKVARGDCDGVSLAAAGLRRLGVKPRGLVVEPLPLGRFLHSPGQGAIAIVARRRGPWTKPLARLDHPPTRLETQAEREVMRSLSAGCIAPVAAGARLRHHRIHLRAEVLSHDGRRSIQAEADFPPGSAAGPRRLARRLLDGGGGELIAEAKKFLRQRG